MTHDQIDAEMLRDHWKALQTIMSADYDTLTPYRLYAALEIVQHAIYLHGIAQRRITRFEKRDDQ